MQLSARMCSYCNLHQCPLMKSTIYTQVRSSATVKPAGNIVTTKRKHKIQKFAELLEISNHAENRKAAVQKLKASDLSMLAGQPEISIDNLHKLRELSNIRRISNKNINKCQPSVSVNLTAASTQSFKIISHNDTSTVSRNKKQSQLLTLSSVDCDNAIHIATATSILKQVGISTKHFLTKRYREEPLDKFTTQIMGYIDVCLTQNRPDLASTGLMLYRLRSEHDQCQSKYAVHMYNQLLGYFAKCGDMSNVMSLYQELKDRSILPVPQTFAYIFEALARQQAATEKETEILKVLSSDIENYSITLNDIFLKSYFDKDRENITLRGVRMLTPNFELSHPLPTVDYETELLKDIHEMDNSASLRDLFTVNEMQKNMVVQLDTEANLTVTIDSVIKYEETDKTRQIEQLQKNLEEQWKIKASQAFRQKRAFLKQQEMKNYAKVPIYPFLEVLDEREYVKILMETITTCTQNVNVTYRVNSKILRRKMGDMVHQRYLSRKAEEIGALKSTVNVYTKYLDWYVNRVLPGNHKIASANHRNAWQFIEHFEKKHGRLVRMNITPWSRDTIMEIGRFLLDIILDDIKINKKMLKSKSSGTIPAFYTVMKFDNAMYLEEVKAHPALTDIYSSTPRKKLCFLATEVPFSSVPLPWNSLQRGVNFKTYPEFIRSHEGLIDLDYLNDCPPSDFYPTMDAVNELGAVPWMINCPVLDIILKVFQEGGSEELNVPLSPSMIDDTPPKNLTDKIKLSEFKRRIRKRKQETYSLWCDGLYRLSIANHFRNKIFWLPHNIDFRGRAYTIAPHLSHLGADLGRSLLVFAQKKPLGPKGLDWLKIHLINLTGLKKRNSVAERLSYADEILDDILDSAEKPLTGRKWWTKADEPWQALAACIELAAVLKCPDPQNFMSGFPIHQDGSCNGLQHYAALGRDPLGAKSVNLSCNPVPQDVYSAIATLMEERRRAEAQSNNPIAQILEGHVVRKVIKQTVMTTVYGVTKYGAKLQIQKRLLELGLSDKDAFHGSTYLSHLTFDTLASMFQNARQIQDWFVQIANYVTIDYRQCLMWRTPLGLPVMQPYKKRLKNSKKPKAELECTQGVPDGRKQRNAFPPNFIHSLDSCHMMLTSLKCAKQDVTFVAIHDCYWTHACTVDVMNKICREKFVALHSQPILDDLAADILNQYSTKKWLPDSKKHSNERGAKTLEENFRAHLQNVPKKGEFDIEEVLKSTYFFS